METWEHHFAHIIQHQQHTHGADAAHDHSHIQRVVASAKHIARHEHACLEIVVPAAWLHDCVTIAKDSPHRKRASILAATTAVASLRGLHYPPRYLPGIWHAIAAHSFSANIAPRTIEAMVVQDADRLDALGAIGIARCLMLGGSMGKPLYHPQQPFPTTRTPDDTRYVIDHFHTKLLTLANTMHTTSGRAEAHTRTRVMQNFLHRLAHELSD